MALQYRFCHSPIHKYIQYIQSDQPVVGLTYQRVSCDLKAETPDDTT